MNMYDALNQLSNYYFAQLEKIVYPEIMEKDQDLQRHAELNLKRMLGNPDADKSKDMLTGMAKSKGYRDLSVKNKRG